MKQNIKGSTIAGGFVWKFSERLLSQGVSFLVSLVLARLLSADDYGLIALVLVFINLGSVFITSGFSSALIQKKDANDEDFSTMFYCSLICSVVIYGIVYFAAPWVANFYNIQLLVTVLRVYALQIPLSVYYSIQSAYISRNMLFKKSFFSSAISSLTSAFVGIGMAAAAMGVWALVAQTISMTLTNTIVLAIVIPWRPRKMFSFKTAKQMMKFGSKVLAADLSGTFFGEVRSLLIGRVYTSADLAYYTKAQQLPSLITGNLSTSVMTVLFPALANEIDDLSRVKTLTKQSMRLTAFILFPALFGLAAIMESLIVLLYTEKWAASIPYAQLLCVGSALGVLGVIPLQVLKAIGRSDMLLNLEFYKKPIYVLLLIISVRINVYVIAVTMVIYEVYGLLINMWQLKKCIEYSLFEQLNDIFVFILLAGVMAFIVLIVPKFDSVMFTIAVKTITGAVFYLTASKIFKIRELQILKDIVAAKLRK